MPQNAADQLASQIMDFYNQYDLKISGKINNQTAYQLIETIEQKYDTDAICLSDGTRLWNLLRVFLYSNFQKLGEQTTGDRPRTFTRHSVSSIVKDSLHSLQYPTDVTVCGFSSGESRKLVENTYYDIYLDPLYDILADRLAVFEWPEITGQRRSYDHPLYSRHHVPMHIPLTTTTFWKLLFHQLTGYRGYTIRSEHTLDAIIENLSTTASLDKQQLTTDIYAFITVFVHIKTFLRSILQKIHPHAVLIRCGYGRFPMALSQACHELHIPAIELQHGLITAYLPAYRRSTPTSNRDCIPDYLLTHGEIYADLVRHGNLFEPSKVIATGYPYLQRLLHTTTPNKSKYSSFTHTVLFTSQWIVAEEIQDFVLKIAGLLTTAQMDVGILFKPHPYDKRDYTEMTGHPHITLIDKYDDTFSLFRIADIHSTVYSTSGLEAMAFGTPNIFVDLHGLLPPSDTPYIVSTPEQFVTSVSTILSRYQDAVAETKAVADQFFTAEPLEHLTQFFTTQGVLSKKQSAKGF
ncbi:MAG: hypothetical protein JXA00_03060 [Candidatus Thermoplasmatota archaeon]|nr:hypothetical protein [Candidatus Thermoplasmatota archaeon]